MADRTFLLKIIGDTTGASKALGQVSKDAQDTESKTTGAFKAIAGAVSVAAVVAFGKSVVDAASSQEQAMGAVDSVFKETAGTIHDFSKTTAENMGISRGEFEETASTMGALLKNAGMPLDDVADSTINLSKRAADLASMYGGTVPEAMDAMKSALKGEMDPLEKYGVSLKASAIEARAVADGHVDAEGKATAYGKALATQALIMEQSADAAGNFAKEGNTVAGQTERMKAQFKDLQADLGTMLLPILTKVAEMLRGIIGFVKDNQGWLVPLAAAIMGIVVAVKAWQLAQTAWSIATTAATAVQWLFNAAMAANPIGLIVIAITAVIAAVVLLYTKVDWFRAAVDAAIDGIVAAWNWLWDILKGVFNWIKDNWPLLLAIITGPIGIAVKLIVDNWETIKNAVRGVIDWIKQNWPLLLAILTGPFGLAVLAIQRNWDTIKNAVRTAIDGIRNTLSNVWDIISYPFKRGVQIATDAWNGLMRLIQGAWNTINNALHGVADVIKYPFKIAIDAIKSLWNNTIGRFSFTVPSWVPGLGGKGWSMPKMAAGGIVTRPTVALIGEAGPEAVVPLGKSGGLGFGNVTINVYALTANAEVGRQVWNALREYERTSGKAIA